MNKNQVEKVIWWAYIDFIYYLRLLLNLKDLLLN